MSADVVGWFKSIGIIADMPLGVRGTVLYEETIRLHHSVSLNECLILSLSIISPQTALLDTYVGRYCSIGHNCTIGFSSHPMDRLTTSTLTYENSFNVDGDYHLQSYGPQTKRVTIGHDVWIGAGASILPGLTIGTGAVIGAGSVVTKDVEPYAIVAGNPAVKKRSRFSAEAVEIITASEWWRYDLRQAVQRGLIADWSDPVSAVRSLEDGFAKGDIAKIDVPGRLLQGEDGIFKSTILQQKIFV